jgi:hypothetical protein
MFLWLPTWLVLQRQSKKEERRRWCFGLMIELKGLESGLLLRWTCITYGPIMDKDFFFDKIMDTH